MTLACVWMNRLPEAAAAADAKLSLTNPNEQDYLRSASLHA